MKIVRVMYRILVPASLVLLAACQSMPSKKETATATTPTADTMLQASSQGAPVAVFLADTSARDGWTPVQIQAGNTLYVNPEPVLTRNDLSGIKAGTNKAGDGLLALELNDAGKQKVVDVTTKNPNKRLALVVGRTMMAAPSYTTPVKAGQLVFAVGTEQNATAAARAIAGASAARQGTPDNGPAQPQAPTSSGRTTVEPALAQ